MAKSTKKSAGNATQSHLIIDAGPGSGKTTTMIAGLNLLNGVKPSWFKSATDEQKAIWEAMQGKYKRIGFQAFNKSIATEIEQKVPDFVDVKTFHAFGLSILRSNGFKVKASASNDQYAIRELMGYEKNDRMKKEDYETSVLAAKLIGLHKNNLLEPTMQNMLTLVENNGLEINGNAADVLSLVQKAMKKSLNIKSGSFAWISFDDMLWLPIALDLDFDPVRFDLLICDESQDLNPVQHELVVRSADRLICVGDPRQAIYGFRGTDSQSMKTIENILAQTDRGVTVLPLQTSFRLPKSGVANVQKFAPNLKARSDAGEGIIEESFIDQIAPQAGDLIVSRINANIFTLAFQLLRQRVPVKIQGRDYGQQLINIIKKECDVKDDIGAAIANIEAYDLKERERLSKKTFSEKLIDAHNEKIRCLTSLADGCSTVQEMIDVIDRLFSEKLENHQCVLLSTVHRAKGLEANNVFFLEPNLVPHPMAKRDDEKQQEFNLKFVAETRHIEKLIYVFERSDLDDSRDFHENRLIEQEVE